MDVLGAKLSQEAKQLESEAEKKAESIAKLNLQ